MNSLICCLEILSTGRADSEEGGLGKRVVLDLVKGRKHHIYFDNFFDSVSLLTTLQEKGLYGCGTARQNYKEYPEVLKCKGKSKRELATHGLVNTYSAHAYTCTYIAFHATPRIDS